MKLRFVLRASLIAAALASSATASAQGWSDIFYGSDPATQKCPKRTEENKFDWDACVLSFSSYASRRYYAAHEIAGSCKTALCGVALGETLERDEDALVRGAAATGLRHHGDAGEAALRSALAREAARRDSVVEPILGSLEQMAHARKGLAQETIQAALATYSATAPQGVRSATGKLVGKLLELSSKASQADAVNAYVQLSLRSLATETDASAQQAWVLALGPACDDPRVIERLGAMVRTRALADTSRHWALRILAGWADIQWKLRRADAARLFVELASGNDPEDQLVAVQAISRAVPSDDAGLEAAVCQGLRRIRELSKTSPDAQGTRQTVRIAARLSLGGPFEKAWAPRCR